MYYLYSHWLHNWTLALYKSVDKNTSLNFNVAPLLIFCLYYGECLCDNCTPSFLSLLIFDWRTFSKRVTARWWRQSAKNQVSTNQNWRNRWCVIVRRSICICSKSLLENSERMFLSLFLPLHYGLDYPFPKVIIMAGRIVRLVYWA